MITKTIKYTDYFGNERTEKHNFHLNKAELMKMEMGVKGGLTDMMERIIEAQDNPELMKIFEELIHKAYGVISPDGKNFIKNEEVLQQFVQSEAYAELFMELITDSKKAAEFFAGVIPADMAKELPENYMDQVPEQYKQYINEVK